MKIRTTIFALALLASMHLSALDASISYATFNANGNPYVEIYLSIIGQSVAFAQADYQNNSAAVEVTILFKQGDQIVKFDKYKLNSPLTTSTSVNFVDQKRYPLANGEYVVDISIRDLNQDGNETNWSQPLSLNYTDTALEQSDIQLLGAFKESEPIPGFTKNGYYLETLPFNFYNKKADKLGFYNEIYNADKAIGDEYLIRYFIDEVGNNNKRTTLKMGHKKRKPSAVNVILLQMDIKELASGNYYLTVEVRDRAGELKSSKEVFFQRSNPYLEAAALATADIQDEFVTRLSDEELIYSLRAIAMKVPDRDVEILNYILSNKNPQAMRNYLFGYYAKRNPNQPELAYEKYMEVARAVDKTYKSGFGFGFETDRGVTFLKYGRPNNIVNVEDEPSAPPYEIWVYDDFPFTAQARVKFIFYNPSLAGGHYRLLHSTARGELFNPQWEIDLYSDNPEAFNGANSFDSDAVSDGIRRQARRLWEDM